MIPLGHGESHVLYMFYKEGKGDAEMSEETRLEVIKALAYGMDIGDIANMAEVDEAEIERIREECAGEIARRREEITEGTGNGD